MSTNIDKAAAYPFRNTLPTVKDAWYVAAYSSEVSETPFERWLLNVPLVMYRDASGRVIVLDATCPHRGYSLAKGKVIDSCIVCPYHGLRFGADGQCIHAPSQDHAPPRMAVRSYLVYEIFGWVWIWAGDKQKATAFPKLPGICDDDKWVIDVSLYEFVQARAQLMNDNLLDLTHVTFLHSDSIGSPDVAVTEQECSYGEHWASSRRYVRHAHLTPALQVAWGIDGLVDRELIQTFYIPSIHCGSDRFLRSEDAATPDAGEILACRRNFHAVTPATSTSSHYFFARASERKAITRPPISIDYQRLIDQDIEAVELIEKRLAAGIIPKDISLKADAHALRARKMIQDWMYTADDEFSNGSR